MLTDKKIEVFKDKLVKYIKKVRINLNGNRSKGRDEFIDEIIKIMDGFIESCKDKREYSDAPKEINMLCMKPTPKTKNLVGKYGTVVMTPAESKSIDEERNSK